MINQTHKFMTYQPKNFILRFFTAVLLMPLLLSATGYAQICGSIGFYSPVNFPVGGRLQSVDVGDFNLDGKHDLVTANAVTTVVSVLLGKGDGTFQTSVDVNAGNNPGDSAVGDFNGDGKPDIAVANSGGNNISVLINTCAAAPCSSPSFAAPVNYASGNRPRRITTGDVNRDNILDLMTANENANSISVLLGNGNGTFRAKVDFNPIGTQPYDVQVGDFNGDNKLDMVAVNFGMGDTAAVFINTCNSTPCANPSFAAAVTYAVGESPMGVTVADFNGDNRLDIATANYFSSDVSILLGNGNGTFHNAVNYPSASLPNNITATDLDGDSYLDLVTTVDIGSLISVFRGRGDGTFEAKADFNVGQSGASDVSKAVAAEDFNGDTLIDLAVAVDMFNNVSMMMNGCGDPPISNTAPSITAGSALSRTQGAGAANATIATVSDAETAAGSLTVAATTVPAGISVSNITNINGTIKADVGASCAASAGAKTVVLTVTDDGGMTNTANLTVNVTANAISISAHPTNKTVVVGGSATFSVTASGSNLSYQWRRNGNPIGGATASSYTINSVATGDAGNYDVVVTGACGTVTSNAASLTVNKADVSISLSSSQNPTFGGDPAAFTVTISAVAPAAGIPTGTVNFLADGSAIADCQNILLSGSAQAQCTTVDLAEGVHIITVQYNGDTSFNTKTGSLSGNQEVLPPLVVTVDDDFIGYNGQNLGNGRVFNRNAFNTLQGAINAVGEVAGNLMRNASNRVKRAANNGVSGGTINVEPGSYTSANLNKNVTVNLKGDVSMSGNLTISAGTWNLPTDGTFALSGNLTQTGGTFTPNSEDLNFNGSSAQTFTPVDPVTVTNLKVDNVAGVTINQNVTVSGLLDLTNGKITVGNGFSLSLAATATTNATDDPLSNPTATSYVVGNLKKAFAGAGNFVFPVGTATGYSPLKANVTAGTGDLAVKAVDGNRTPASMANQSLQRYWTITDGGGGLTADLTFNYLQGDVAGDESQYSIIKMVGVSQTVFRHNPPNVAIDTANNQATILGVNSFSDWTLAVTLPTAASATVSGRVINQAGRGIKGALVAVTDAAGNLRYAVTNAFGYYNLANVAVGQGYQVTVRAKRYTFANATQMLNLTGDTEEVNFQSQQ